MIDQIHTATSTAIVAAVMTPSNGNGRIVWPGGPAKKQNFCIPDNIIYYMGKNPSSPEGYLQLAMSCKYFFEKKPLLVVGRIHREKMCSSKEEEECKKKKGKCCVKVNIAKLISKIWLAHRYYFINTPAYNALLLQKLYDCKNATLHCSAQTIVFENFKLVASSFEKFDLIFVRMKYNDGSIVLLEDILGSLSNVKEFEYTFCIVAPAATSSTLKKICKLGNLDNLRIFHLYKVPELFGLKDFEMFIMNHKNTKFWLLFLYLVSREYTSQLDLISDTVIASETSKCVIVYKRLDDEKLAIMLERYDN